MKLPFLKSYRKLRLWKPSRRETVIFLSILISVLGIRMLFSVVIYLLILAQDTPSFQQLEDPESSLSYASVAYTEDGVELARFGRQNRTWIPYDSISAHTRNALIATEDHRFYDHWGIDLFRTSSATIQTILGALGLPFERQGGSTITQQLARNLYNEQVGSEVSVKRKLKEIVTAVRLEKRFAKNEIVEMYLNTVSFLYNAHGIEAAARTYFDKSATDLDLIESAVLVGLLKGPYRYDPQRHPERSKIRRNTVLQRMITRKYLEEEKYHAIKDSATVLRLRTAEVTQSIAPYFAEKIRQMVSEWGRAENVDVYGTRLRIETTLDSKLQSIAQDAVASTLDGLQAVVNCEWSASSSPRLQFGADISRYLSDPCHTNQENHWAWFWERNQSLLRTYISESSRYQTLQNQGKTRNEILQELTSNSAFVDSLKRAKSRLENGFVAMNPKNGHVKAWVGGRDLSRDWYDHVSVAKRQPGSVFKPFTYAAAIKDGYSPNEMYLDSVFQYPTGVAGEIWSPQNFSDKSSGDSVSMREGLAKSLNTVTAQIINKINPENVKVLAGDMGINSELLGVQSLALGTSEVTLLESVTAYSTFANEGFRTDPVLITRILDETGKTLYPHEYQQEEDSLGTGHWWIPDPRQKNVLSKETSTIVIDMLQDVITKPHGTGFRIRRDYNLWGYDFAGKTGTTQNGADGWFILMHPDLVTGSWVGFNDLRMNFRSTYWGQGAHNALFVVGEFMRASHEQNMINMESRFPDPPPQNESMENRITW